MATRLVFSINRELLNFIVRNKDIFYTDRKWKKWLQCMPQNDEFIKKIRMSRNAFPAFLTQLFNFSAEELKQYDNCKDEKDVAIMIKKDAASKGCKLLSEEEVQIELGKP